MAIKAIGASSGTVADVDGDRNQRIVCRTPALGGGGAFTGVFVTGAIAATSSINAIHWSMQNFNPYRLLLVEEVTVSAFVVSTITTGLVYELKLEGVAGSTRPTGGVNWTGVLQNRRSSMPQSVAQIITNTTTAAGLTGATNLGQNNPYSFGRVSGNSGTVTGTQFFTPNNATLFSCKRMWGSHPIVIGLNDIIEIRQVAAGPASGTFTIVIKVAWSEVPIGLAPLTTSNQPTGALSGF